MCSTDCSAATQKTTTNIYRWETYDDERTHSQFTKPLPFSFNDMVIDTLGTLEKLPFWRAKKCVY